MLSEHCVGNALSYSPDSPGSFISSMLKDLPHSPMCHGSAALQVNITYSWYQRN